MSPRRCALVVDGGAALAEDVAAGLVVVPVRITLGDGEFIDAGEARSYARFYQRLRESEEIPRTSTPAPGEYLDAFRRAEGDHIVCLTIPSTWSGMYAAASVAAAMLAEEEGTPRVTVLEVSAAAVGLGLVARAAAQVCAAGGGAEAVVQEARRAAQGVCMYGSLATLTYVARSGRVPALVAGISNTLHIRPVFRMQGTQTARVALARTLSGALDALQRAAQEQLDASQHWALLFHADAPDEVTALGERLSGVSRVTRCETVALSPIAGAYTGPGAFGFAVLPLPDVP